MASSNGVRKAKVVTRDIGAKASTAHRKDAVGNVVPWSYQYKGVEDLVTMVLRVAQAAAFERRESMEVPSHCLKQMIELSYAASLMREEGQFTEFQIHYPLTGSLEEWVGVEMRFGAPLPLLEPEILKKLVPACPLPGRMIVVAEGRAGLDAIGVFKQKEPHSVAPIGSPYFSMVALIKGSTVKVLGPGHLVVYGKHPPLELRGGRIVSPIVRFAEYPAVADSFREIIADLFGLRVRFVPGLPDATDRRTMIPYYVTTVWQRLLQQSRRSERGGAFIICSDPSRVKAKIKYPLADADLGRRLVEHWDACFDTPADGMIDDGKLQTWRGAESSLLNSVDMLASVSRVDGCVLLDRRLCAAGFGVKLLELVKPQRMLKFVDPFTKEAAPDLPAKVGRFGTRHLSAFQFCCAHDNSIAFVISQDGDVRVFLQREGIVSMIDATSAELTQTYGNSLLGLVAGMP